MKNVIQKINMSLFEGGDVIMTKGEFEEKVEKENLEVYNEKGIAKFVNDVNDLIEKGENPETPLVDEEVASIEKSETELKSLSPIRHYDESGNIVTKFIRVKAQAEEQK